MSTNHSNALRILSPHNEEQVAPPTTNVVKDEKFLTVREVARRLRVDDTTVRRWAARGLLEVVTLPHRNTRRSYRIRESTLDGLIDNPATLQ